VNGGRVVSRAPDAASGLVIEKWEELMVEAPYCIESRQLVDFKFRSDCQNPYNRCLSLRRRLSA
jgi:hypothetical protein